VKKRAMAVDSPQELGSPRQCIRHRTDAREV
jgi:hypothetical protein